MVFILAPFGAHFGDFWGQKGCSERKSWIFENVDFPLLLQAKSKVGGSKIETFSHPGATFSTSGNEVDFLIGFGRQKSPNELILGPFWRPNPSKRASKKPSEK